MSFTYVHETIYDRVPETGSWRSTFHAACDACGWRSKEADDQWRAEKWVDLHRERGCPASR